MSTETGSVGSAFNLVANSQYRNAVVGSAFNLVANSQYRNAVASGPSFYCRHITENADPTLP
ncbi:MAG TPA: hypothetical protein VF251_01405, partial [Pyrinomonadaceae bacterium]